MKIISDLFKLQFIHLINFVLTSPFKMTYAAQFKVASQLCGFGTLASAIFLMTPKHVYSGGSIERKY